MKFPSLFKAMRKDLLEFTKNALKECHLKVGAKKKADRKYTEQQTIYNTALLAFSGEEKFKEQIRIIKNN